MAESQPKVEADPLRSMELLTEARRLGLLSEEEYAAKSAALFSAPTKSLVKQLKPTTEVLRSKLSIMMGTAETRDLVFSCSEPSRTNAAYCGWVPAAAVPVAPSRDCRWSRLP